VDDPWRDQAWRARMLRRFGAEVEAWCDDVPRLAGELAASWQLSDLEPVPAGGTSRVIACRRASGERAYLKLTPEHELARDEALALRAWQSGGRAPRVLGFDAAARALLLEAIEPGTAVAVAPETATVEAVAVLIAALHVAPPSGLPPLSGRVDFVFDITRTRARGSQVPKAAVDRSHDAARTLAGNAPGEPVLLHGDLHLRNVLTGPAGRELVAIDPRACLGDPAFDLVDWIIDCAPPDQWPRRSAALAAATGVADERLWGWVRALAVVTAAARAARGQGVEHLLALVP
jgi:streptomycin 6-kinase